MDGIINKVKREPMKLEFTKKQGEVLLVALEMAMRSACNGNGSISYKATENMYFKIAKLVNPKKETYLDLG